MEVATEAAGAIGTGGLCPRLEPGCTWLLKFLSSTRCIPYPGTSAVVDGGGPPIIREMPRSRVLKNRPTSFPGAKFDPCASCHHQNQETYVYISCYTSPKPGTQAVNSLLPQECATITGIPKMTASQPAKTDIVKCLYKKFSKGFCTWFP